MVENRDAWTPRSPWADIVAAPTQFGADGAPGLVVTLVDGLGLATLIVRHDPAPLAAVLKTKLGIDLPQKPMRAGSGGHAVIWTGPGQWLLVAERRDGFPALLTSLLDVAAVSDQSQGRAVHRIAGPAVREFLSRGFMLDMHDRTFPVGSAASTVVAHVGVQIARLPDSAGGAVFEIMVPRSYAGSYWSWLAASAAPFGCRVEAQAA